MRKPVFIGLALALTALAVLLTTLPGYAGLIERVSALISGVSFADSVAHFVLFSVLTAIWYGFLRRVAGPRRAAALAVTLSVTVGLVTEAAQVFMPDRGASWDDLLANILGPLTLLVWLRLRS